VIDTTTSPPTAWIDGSNLFSAQSAIGALAKAKPVKVEVLFNPHLKTSWYMVPALIGLILTFIGTIITSIGLVVSERRELWSSWR
jgi:ABC-2 type transport system permease protein